MKQPRKAKTMRLEEQDKAAIAALRDYYALSSDNEAIRFALRRAHREIEQQAPTHHAPKGRPIHPPLGKTEAFWAVHCKTCGTQFAPGEQPPEACPICLDERQYVGYGGQQWTTLAQMQKDGFRNEFREHEPHLIGIGTTPSFAIGERALLVQNEHGNVLWDCMSLIDDETVVAIERLGGLTAIAISHPHYYSTMVEWADRFQVPIYLHANDQEWVMRPSERIRFWSGDIYALSDDITLIRLGGHFPGGTVLHWKRGADGKGALLSGDIIQVVADHRWVSFMYSYPNLIPLSAADVQRIRDAIAPFQFERLYGAWFERVIMHHAHDAVLRSADRYIHALETMHR